MIAGKNTYYVIVHIIASGQDETIEDALYDLLKDLFIEVPRAAPFIIKLQTFFSMIWDGIPAKQAKSVFLHTHHQGEKGKILSAAGKNSLTTSELVQWLSVDKELRKGFPEVVYTEGVTQQNVGRLSRFEPERMSMVRAVAELYLEREIMFEKLGVAE